MSVPAGMTELWIHFEYNCVGRGVIAWDVFPETMPVEGFHHRNVCPAQDFDRQVVAAVDAPWSSDFEMLDDSLGGSAWLRAIWRAPYALDL